MVTDALIAPFTEFEFMRRALAAVIALSLGAAPIGVFLMLRRMSLVGDAMAHAILPGAAIGFLVSGLSLFAMTTGGLIAGFVVAILAGVVARNTEMKEDASLATFYLVSLALGVTIVSIKGTNIDLLHVLFGNILAMDDQTLLVIAFNATITLLVLAVIYRPLVIECVDPVFLRTVSRAGAPAHLAFLALVVINLVNGFHALGTLLGGRTDDPARGHRAVLVARHHRHDLHRGRERHGVGLCRTGAVVPDQGFPPAPRSSWWRRDLCRVGAVRQCQRPGAADVPRPPSRGIASMRRLFGLIWSGVDRDRVSRARRGPPQHRRQLLDPRRLRPQCRRRARRASRRWSVPTATRMSMRRRRRMRRRSRTRNSWSSTASGSKAGCRGWCKSAGGKALHRDGDAGIAPLKLGSDADPHAWQSVANAKIYVGQYPGRAGRRRSRRRRGFFAPMPTPIWPNSMPSTARCGRRSRKSRKTAAR